MVISEIFTGDVPYDSPELRRMLLPTYLAQIHSGLRPEIPNNVKSEYPWLFEMVDIIFILLLKS